MLVLCALACEVVHREPFEISDLLLQRQLDGELLVVISVKNVGLASLIRHNEPLRVGPTAGPGPEESVAAVAIVDKVLKQQSVLVHRVHVSAHLRWMVVDDRYARGSSLQVFDQAISGWRKVSNYTAASLIKKRRMCGKSDRPADCQSEGREQPWRELFPRGKLRNCSNPSDTPGH